MKTNKLIGLAIVLLAIPLTGRAQEAGPALIGEGAQVFAANCMRCHNARAGSERSDADWIPITLHMRARANMTRQQARAVLAFLQATNQDPSNATGTSALMANPTEPRPEATPVSPVGQSWMQSENRLRRLLRLKGVDPR